MRHFIIFSILSIIISSPPPIPQPDYQTFAETPMVQNYDNQKSSLKHLEAAKIISESTNVDVYFSENERIEVHSIKITPVNLENGYFPSLSFSQKLPKGKTLKLNSNFCKKDSVPEELEELEENKCTPEFIENGQEYKFRYNFTLEKDQHIIITYNISIIKESKEILYKQESVSVSSLYKTGTCTFKFTIPDYYTYLGLKNNLLEKKSDREYVYNGECPSEAINEVIRFAPNQSFWKAQVNIYCSSSSKISDNVTMTFPRYYRGGKNKNKNYKITLYDGTKLNESALIKDETFLKVIVPGKNNKKIGFNINTAFSNKLNEKFDVYTSENFYQIDENIDDVIKAKTQEIINNSSSQYKDYPNYYKIGKFLSSYMTYDLSYHGKDKTALEIYNEKKGVCEHYTILYNAMLNSIGIKTLKTFGWAFQKDEISANQSTIGHAWTVALIDNKWIELDPTWDLFEGIPAGHIFKGFNKERYSYSSKSSIELEFTTNINLVDNLDDEEDDALIISSIKDTYQENESTILKTNINKQINSTTPTIIKSYQENESTILKSNIIKQNNSSSPIINSTSLINNLISTNIGPKEPINSQTIIISTKSSNIISDSITSKVIYTIFIFQIQLINNYIRIYILADFPIKKNDSLNLICKLYYQNLRNLQQEKGVDATTTLYATENFDKDKIAVFSSLNKFNNIKRVEGQEVRFNNKGNNDANIILLDNNKDCLDTDKVETKIKQGGLDYSNLPSGYKISQYKISSASQGCSFDLKSNSIINEENKQIKLNFLNKKSGDVNANCILNKNNEKSNSIPCTLNENIDSNYILEDYIQSNNKETLTIIQSNKSSELYLNCSLGLKIKPIKDSGKGGLKTGVIICLIIIAVLLLLGITFLIICFIKKTKGKNLDNEKNNTNKTNNEISFPSSESNSQ